MAIVRAQEIRGNSIDNLEDKLNELRLELAKEKSAARAGVPKNPGRMRELRRSIARILTVINEGEYADKPAKKKKKSKPKKDKKNEKDKKEEKKETDEEVEIVDTKIEDDDKSDNKQKEEDTEK